jgi:hypothetical protein
MAPSQCQQLTRNTSYPCVGYYNELHHSLGNICIDPHYAYNGLTPVKYLFD